MISTTGDYPERLNLAEQAARIERMNEETAKLSAETLKLQSEGRKPGCNAWRSLDRDPAIAPITLLVAILSGFVACFAAGAAFMRAGWAP